MSRKRRRQELRNDLSILNDILEELQKIGQTLSKVQKEQLVETVVEETKEEGEDPHWLVRVMSQMGPLIAELAPMLLEAI
jgi:hypothetical protein